MSVNPCTQSSRTQVDYSQGLQRLAEVKVADSRGKKWPEDSIILPSELYKNLHARVGKMSLLNPLNNTSCRVYRVVQSTSIVGGNESENYSPYSFLDKISQEGRNEICVGKKIQQELNLQTGSSVSLQNILNPADRVVADSCEDKENQFGKSWEGRSYIAKGIFNGYQEDITPGRFGVFLGVMQISYLMLSKTLRPLCGETRYQTAQSYNENAVGVIQLFHNGKVLEADVYHSNHCGEADSTISITESLYNQLGSINRGDSLTLCSRFDVNSEQEAREKVQAPILTHEPPYDALQLVRKAEYLSLEEVPGNDKNDKTPAQRANMFLSEALVNKKRAVKSADFIPQQKFAHFLESLSFQAAELAANPALLARVFDFLDNTYYISGIKEMIEFEAFLNSIKAHEEIMHSLQHYYMDLVANALKNNGSKHYNPLLLEALFQMEINLKDNQGRNYLHLLFDLKRGSIESLRKSQSLLSTLLTETNLQGETPLHTLCRTGDWEPLIFLKKILSKKCTVAQFINERGETPFHALFKNSDAVQNNNSKIRLFVVMELMIKIFKEDGLKWFEVRDLNGSTPLEYMDIMMLASLLLYTGSEKSKEVQLIRGALAKFFANDEVYQKIKQLL